MARFRGRAGTAKLLAPASAGRRRHRRGRALAHGAKRSREEARARTFWQARRGKGIVIGRSCSWGLVCRPFGWENVSCAARFSETSRAEAGPCDADGG